MAKIKKGDLISLDYEGKLESGEVFDSSTHGDHSHPLEFEVGSQQVIEGFDSAVIGMDKGQEKEFSIPPEKAYGNFNENLKKELPRSSLPAEPEPQVGMTLILSSQNGQQFPARIIKVDKDQVTIDLNHPLAGKKLIFKIKILDIKSPDSKDNKKAKK